MSSGKINQPIIFFGSEDFSATALTKLLAAKFSIAGVVTKPDAPKGRGHKLHAPAVKSIALEHNIPVWQPQKLSDIEPILRSLDRPIGVLVSYGKIIPASILNLFKPGIINLHPSLLPMYRGPSPIEQAIINHDAQTGVTIMQLGAAMDAGPIYAQKIVQLDGTETQASLYPKLADIGADELVRTVPMIIDGTLAAHAQDDSKSSYTNLLKKSNAFIDSSYKTAEAIEAKIRAHLIFPKTKIIYRGAILIIKKAHTSSVQETALDLCMDDKSILVIDEIISPSGRTMDAASFLRGFTGH